jgi:small-conductance mechanosensitive channel
MWSTAIATLVFFVIITNALVSTVKKVTHDDNNKRGSTSIIENVIRIIFFCLGALVILEEFNISITPILTALGVGALAVALALQDTLGNLFSGISVIAGKRIKPGHYIKLNSGEEGFIEDISWRSTVIRETNNNRIIVPNQKIATAIISNYNLSHEELLVRIPMGVAYSSDLEKVDRLCVEEALHVQQELYGESIDFNPFIRYRAFGDSSINFIVVMKMKNYTDQFLITDSFIRKIHSRFKKEEIEIPFPMRTIIHRQE